MSTAQQVATLIVYVVALSAIRAEAVQADRVRRETLAKLNVYKKANVETDDPTANLDVVGDFERTQLKNVDKFKFGSRIGNIKDVPYEF